MKRKPYILRRYNLAGMLRPKTFWRAEAAPKLYLRVAFETDAAAAVAAFQPFDDVDRGDWPAWGETKRPRPGRPRARQRSTPSASDQMP